MRTNILSGSTAVLFAAFTLTTSHPITWPMVVLGVAFLASLVLSLRSAHEGDPTPAAPAKDASKEPAP